MRTIAMTLGTVSTMYVLAGASPAAAQASGTAAAQAGQTAALHACSLVSEADIVRVTGKPNRLNVPIQRSELPNGHTECAYYDLIVTLTPRMTPAWFERTRKQSEIAKNVTIEAVSGVGEEAYLYVQSMRSMSQVAIFSRRGQYQFTLGDLSSADSVAWMKPKLVELAKLAAAKVR